MASVVTGMQYVIYFNDVSEAQFALSALGGNYATITPRDAALMFGIPYPYPPAGSPRGITFYTPYTPGAEIKYPNASGIFVDDNVLAKTVPAQASNTGTFGPDGVFTWVAQVICWGGALGEIIENIKRRRFAVGFEAQGSQEIAGSTLGNKNITRDASRIANGFGFALRKAAAATNQQVAINTVITPADPWHNWDRFYFRLRYANPTADTYIWFAAGGSTPSQIQVRLRADAGGTLSLISYNGVTNTVMGTTSFQLVIDQWYRIDIFHQWNNLPASGSAWLRLHVNGVMCVSAFSTTGPGGNANTVTGMTYSRLGVGNESNAGATNTIDCDFDDWVNADEPGNDGITLLPISLDALIGSHIREHYVTADGPARANWGSLPAMVGNQQRNDNTTFVTSANAFTTIVNNALLDLITDINELQELFGISLGVASVVVTSSTIDPDVGVTGKMGWTINGVQTLQSIADTAIAQHFALYRSPDTLIPTSIIPFNVQRQKGNSVNQVQALGLYPYVEYLGIFDACDDPSGQTLRIPKLTHNAPYFNTVYAQLGSPVASDVFMYGGTYTGNGTQQEIALPCPVHFVWIRATGGVGVTPVTWFSWQWGGHRQPQYGANDFEPIRICYDPLAGVFKMTIVGSGTSFINNAGTVYQIIAFSDVGMRYMLNDAVAYQNAAVTAQLPFIDTFFTPDAGFFAHENAATTATNHVWYKGSGNGGNDANPLTAGGTASNIGGWLTGQVILSTALNALSVTKGYSVWRLNDGSNQWAWQRTNYTGNGAGGTRVINLPLASGRFPLFAMVCPHNAISWYRDPTHAGGNSSQYGSSTDSANGIVGGGIDTISVGTSLNANGIVYDVFVIMGSPSGWLNGLYWPGNYAGGGSEFTPPHVPPPSVNIFGQGGLELGATTPLTLLKDISGIYTLVPGKRTDTMIDRQTGQSSVDAEIPDPTFKTGYVGG